MVCGGLGVSPACVASAACRRLRLLYLGGAEPSCILYQLTNDVLHRIATATVDVMLGGLRDDQRAAWHSNGNACGLASNPTVPLDTTPKAQALCPRGRLNIYIYICMKFH